MALHSDAKSLYREPEKGGSSDGELFSDAVVPQMTGTGPIGYKSATSWCLQRGDYIPRKLLMWFSTIAGEQGEGDWWSA